MHFADDVNVVLTVVSWCYPGRTTFLTRLQLRRELGYARMPTTEVPKLVNDDTNDTWTCVQ